MKKSGVEIKDEWIISETLSFKIPSKILEGLGINKFNTGNESSKMSNSPKSRRF